jgi:uncharacterized protein YggT (Ycf19 family)
MIWCSYSLWILITHLVSSNSSYIWTKHISQICAQVIKRYHAYN